MIKYLIIAENNSKLQTLQSLLGPEYSILCLNPQPDFSSLDESPTKYTILETVRLSLKEMRLLDAACKGIKKAFLAFNPDDKGETRAFVLRALLKEKNITSKRLWLSEITKGVLEPSKSSFNRSMVSRFLANEYFEYLLFQKIHIVDSPSKSPATWIDIITLNFLNSIISEESIYNSTGERVTGRFLYKGKVFDAVLSAINGDVAHVPNDYYLRALISDAKQKQFKIDYSSKSVENIAAPTCFNFADFILEANKVLDLSFSELSEKLFTLYYGLANSTDSDFRSFITFPDVDSTALVDSAKARIRERVMSDFGVESVRQNILGKVNQSALCPSNNLAPRQAKKWLDSDNYRLYKIIWNRTICSEMKDVKIESVSVDIADGEDGTYLFQAKEQAVLQRGFWALNGSNGCLETPIKVEFTHNSNIQLQKIIRGKKQPKKNDEIKILLDRLSFLKLTKSEILKSLIRLENSGLIDYANSQYTLTKAGQKILYHLKEKNSELFQIGYVTLLDDLRNRIFESTISLEQLPVQIEKLKDYKLSLQDQSEKNKTAIISMKCEKCGAPLIERSGKFGRFWACSTFPKCDFTQAISIGMKCPIIGCAGDVIERQTKTGKPFFGCSKFPTCNFSTWQKPVNFICPQCKNLYLLEAGDSYKCPKCNFSIVNKEGVPVV